MQKNDDWYAVPPIPVDRGFIEPMYILESGSSAEKTYSLAMYGALPSGECRIIANSFALEFEMR